MAISGSPQSEPGDQYPQNALPQTPISELSNLNTSTSMAKETTLKAQENGGKFSFIEDTPVISTNLSSLASSTSTSIPALEMSASRSDSLMTGSKNNKKPDIPSTPKRSHILQAPAPELFPPAANAEFTRKRQISEQPSSTKRQRTSTSMSPHVVNEEEEEENIFHQHDEVDHAKMVQTARDAGVHSAAALFRSSTPASNRGSRPPMSALYSQLQITPTQFLHLQAAAKEYMLDSNHPERLECIGKKGKGNIEMGRLKLYDITGDFLENEGWGEKCWGRNAPRADQRSLLWPESKNHVILMTQTLLRRMATNEKQRLYAEANRKTTVSKPGLYVKPKFPPTPEEHLAKLREDMDRKERARQRKTSVLIKEVPLPSIEQHDSIEEGVRATSQAAPDKDLQSASEEPAPPLPPSDGLNYYVNVIRAGRRTMPRVHFTSINCDSYATLVQHVNIMIDDGLSHVIKIHVPDGLIEVKDEFTWKGALAIIKDAEWMQGDVKIVIDLGTEK